MCFPLFISLMTKRAKIFARSESCVATDGDEGCPVVGMPVNRIGAAEHCSLRKGQRFGGGSTAVHPVPMKGNHQIRSRVGIDRPQTRHNERNALRNEGPRNPNHPLTVVITSRG